MTNDLYAKMNLYTDDIDYIIIKFPPTGITVAAGILAEISDPFGTIVVDKDEVTLIIPADVMDDFSKRLRDIEKSADTYRLITLDIVLDFSVVGFMAGISKALADAKISILPISAFSRDHILVKTGDFTKAWNVLSALKS
ncbi:MAG: ACT domain-containing protein [Anaerolineae bacterium]|jgi:hypothetical protein|nr:ACT domain-containing protein [Anaerolineae bacterium]